MLQRQGSAVPSTPTSSPPPNFPETPTAADSRASVARRISGTPHRGSIISGTALSPSPPPPPPPPESTVETPVARGQGGGTNYAADGSMPVASISPPAALPAEERPMTAEAERRARLLMQKVEALTTKLEQSRSRRS
jgi:hypothetical protein